MCRLFLYLYLYLNTKHLNCKNVKQYKIFSYKTKSIFYTICKKILFNQVYSLSNYNKKRKFWFIKIF